MKKSIFGKIGAAAVVLTLVTSSLVGGTFAKYTTSVTGSAKATVAKWNVTFEHGEGDSATPFVKDTEVALINENASVVTTNNTIAPGSNGVITLAVNGNDSEIGYTYEIKADMKDFNVPIKFYEYANSTKGKEIMPDVTTKEAILANGSVTQDKLTEEVNVQVYWEWKDTAEGNETDTDLGDGTTLVKGAIPLTITAEQLYTTSTP